MAPGPLLCSGSDRGYDGGGGKGGIGSSHGRSGSGSGENIAGGCSRGGEVGGEDINHGCCRSGEAAYGGSTSLAHGYFSSHDGEVSQCAYFHKRHKKSSIKEESVIPVTPPTARTRSYLGESEHRSSTSKKSLEFLGGSNALQTITTVNSDREIPYHQKLHDLFVCPLDMGVSLGSLADYAALHRNFDLEIPPGDANDDDHLSPVNDTRTLMRRSVEVLQLLHRGDKSLTGKFDFTNFRVDSRKKVKLNNIMPGDLLRFTTRRCEADYGKFALQANAHFFSRGIPSELKPWLKLLLQNPSRWEYLIVHSISLMVPLNAVAHFLVLYGEFLALRGASTSGYQYVVDYLDERHKEWKKRVKMNSFMNDTFTHVDADTKKKAKYGDGAKELLRLCRNFIAHILGKYRGKGLRRRIAYKDILAILNTVFPELLFDLQAAMYHIGILKRLLEFQ